MPLGEPHGRTRVPRGLDSALTNKAFVEWPTAFPNAACVVALVGFTRARVTQRMDLTLLAPDIWEEILVAEVEPGRDVVTERALRANVRRAEWAEQRLAWIELRNMGARCP